MAPGGVTRAAWAGAHQLVVAHADALLNHVILVAAQVSLQALLHRRRAPVCCLHPVPAQRMRSPSLTICGIRRCTPHTDYSRVLSSLGLTM